MADAKYGRIFTEDDVKKIVRHAIEYDVDSDDALMNELKTFDTHFPADEPLFVLRAKDRRSIGAVRFYSDHQSPKAPVSHLESVEDALADFERFRDAHEDRMEDPD